MLKHFVVYSCMVFQVDAFEIVAIFESLIEKNPTEYENYMEVSELYFQKAQVLCYIVIVVVIFSQQNYLSSLDS